MRIRKMLALLCLAAMLCTLIVVPAHAADGKSILDEADFYLTFEDGIKDEKGNHTFTAEGDVPTVDGRFGKGIATDSADHYVYSDDVEVGAGSWTLTAWINVEDHASDMGLIANKDWNSGGNPGFVISQKDDCWRFNGNPGARFDYNPSFREANLNPDRGVWYHLAAVVDREVGEIRWYINGYLCGDPYNISENGDGDLDALSFTLGQDGTGMYGDGFVKATFDEVALIKRALSTEEVVAVYTYAPDGYEPATLEERAEQNDGPSENPAPACGEYTGIVTDGLVLYYDGANNQGVGQDKNATVWRDVSGNGYDFEVSLDGNNHWTDKSYYIDSTANYLPKMATKIANSENYTIELALGEIQQPGTDWISLIISDNDEFSLFVRVSNDVLEYKNCDANGDSNRPVADGGAELANNSTLAVTFDYEEADVYMYVDGEEVSNGFSVNVNDANDMHLGSDSTQRNWLGDVYAIRFYDRTLSSAEIAQNAKADNERYRSGNPIVNPEFETAPAGPAELLNKSWDTIYVDDEMMVDGSANVWLNDNPVSGDISTLRVRGWAHISTEISGFAYAIDGGEAVKSAEFIFDRPDVQAAIDPIANGFDITIDVSGLGDGDHTINFYAVDAGDNLVDTGFAFPFSKGAAAAAYPASGESGNALVGTVIGNETGWGGNADAGAAAAFDGNPATFFDPLGQGDGYCGMDMGRKVVLDKVVILSRADWNARFKGAEIRGNNEDNVDTAVTLWKSDVEGTNPDYYVI
ncbi:MAG: laminin G domain-containing protein, partial [Clostridia bacterium]|nr:laminin G domain-containing protein [Clostridia bacterium]